MKANQVLNMVCRNSMLHENKQIIFNFLLPAKILATDLYPRSEYLTVASHRLMIVCSLCCCLSSVISESCLPQITVVCSPCFSTQAVSPRPVRGLGEPELQQHRPAMQSSARDCEQISWNQENIGHISIPDFLLEVLKNIEEF